MNIQQAIEKVSLKDLIESTGRLPASANVAKGEYLYSAPYREDNDPSLKINIYQKRFIDFGQDDAKGDVVQLARLIMGNGNASSITVSEALQWLKEFSGGRIAATIAKPLQKPEKQASTTSFSGDRFQFVKAILLSGKSHPNNLHYVTEVRKISLEVASRYLYLITYRDTIQKNKEDKGLRYGVGGPNDAEGWEVRASSQGSNFKTSLGPKDITSFNGKSEATTGDIFEGRFDFLTSLDLRGQLQPNNPTIILNTGRFASRAVESIKSREEWQNIKNWRVWQHNDDEGNKTTQTIIEGLGDGYKIGTMHHFWDGYNDLNEWWTNAATEEHDNLIKKFKGIEEQVKFYDTSVTSEFRKVRNLIDRNNKHQL